MNYKDKSREDLIKDLKDLNKKYESLKESCSEDNLSRRTENEKLKKSEEKFRKAFITSPDSININRLSDGMYVSINEGFMRMTGYSEEEVIGKTSLELNIWVDHTDREKLVRGLKDKGKVENQESSFQCKDGSIKIGMLSATIIDLNNLPHILSITRDITDRKNIEYALDQSAKEVQKELEKKRSAEIELQKSYEQLKISKQASLNLLEDIKIEMEQREKAEMAIIEREEKLQSIFSAAPVGIGVVVNRVIAEVNDTLCRMIGYNREELLGKSSLILYPTTEEFELVGKEKYDQISKKGLGSVETRFRCKDGKIINIILSSVPLDYKDYSKGVTFTVLDITSRKKIEDELNLSNRSVNTLISNLQGIVYRCRNDHNWTMEFLSEGTRELTGYSPEELLKNSKISFNDIIHSDDREYIWHDVQVAVKSKQHFQFVYRIITKSGDIRWVWEKGAGLFSHNGELEFLEGFITDITERKNIEEALTQSEEKFRSIAENLSDVIFITDTKGIIQYISPASKIFGYFPEECVGSFFGDFLSEGEYEKAIPVFLNALNSINTDKRVTLLFKRSDGTNFYAELSGSAYKVGNEAIGVLGLLRDVSEKMKQDDELRKLSRVVEQSPASILITDLDGVIEYVNPKLCDVSGFSYDEIIGKTPKLFSSGEKSKSDYNNLWNTIKAGNDWKGDFHNIKKNGELYWERAIISPIIGLTGEITHYLAIKEDITENKESEQRLIESEKRYYELFLSNPVPTYIFDEESLEFVEVNDATVHSYGFSKEEFASMTLKDIRTPEDIQELMESIQSLGKIIFQSASMRHMKKDGTIFPVEITSHSLPVKNGRKTRLVMATDITERIKAADQMKIAKEKAEASDKLKTTFLNNISHEVRTPLNGILGFAEIIGHPDLTGKEREDSLRMLSESSNRLLTTITNYMDISLLTSGSMSVNKKEFIPAQVLSRIYNLYLSQASGKNLKLLLEIPEYSDTVSVNTDPEIFQKIMSHLLNNAIKFTDFGTITFGYSIRNQELEFFVKDTGIGIGKNSIDNIFDRFVKEDRGPSLLSEGSGLGLSIIKGLADILGLKMGVDSELDMGSYFFFTIPINKENEINHSVNIIPGKKGSPLSRKSILIAEDDETNFFFLKALLSRETEATILHASNGREAIQLFIDTPDIQLILMDIKMPEIDGLEATRQIKMINQNIPIIAVTAYAMSGDDEKVLAAGCDGYLSKPITKQGLLDKIAEFVKL